MSDECGKCAFWKEVPTGRKDRRLGMCRRNAPVPVLVAQHPHPVQHGALVPVVNAFFPETRPDIWCGQFERATEMVPGKAVSQIDLSALTELSSKQ